MKKVIGFTIAAFAEIVIVSFIVLLCVTIIYDTAELYNIEAVQLLPKETVFGAFLLLQFILIRTPKPKEVENEKDINPDPWVVFGLVCMRQTIYVTRLLMFWLAIHVIHWFWIGN